MKKIQLFLLLICHFAPNVQAQSFQILFDKLLLSDNDIATAKSIYQSNNETIFPQSLFFIPKIDLNHTHEWNKDMGTNYFLGLRSSLNLFKGGGDLADYKLLAQKRSETYENFHKVSLEKEKTHLNLIFDFISSSRVKSIYQKILDLKQKTLDLGEIRYKKGYISMLERDRLLVDLHITKSKLHEANQEFLEKKTILKQLTGEIDLENEMDWPWKNENLIQKKFLTLKNIKPTEVIPSLRMGEILVKERESKISLAKSRFYPSVELSHEWRYQDYLRKDKNAENSNRRSTQVVLLTMTYPLFDRFDASSQYQLALAEKKQEEYLQKNIQDKTIQEWQVLLQQFPQTLEEVSFLKENLKLSQRIYETLLSYYHQGRIPLTDLFEEQQKLLDSELSYNQILHKLHGQIGKVCHLQGESIKDCICSIL